VIHVAHGQATAKAELIGERSQKPYRIGAAGNSHQKAIQRTCPASEAALHA